MARTWGYTRVSTKDQNEARQVNEILPLLQSDAFLFIDKQSGKTFDRPEYQRLKALMDDGDTLVIKSIDRLGRNYDQIRQEWKEITDRNVYIKVLDFPILDTDKFESDDLMRKFISTLILDILAYVAENELNNIKQRQKEGIAAAKAAGQHFGRPGIEFPENWDDEYQNWKSGEITATEAMKKLGLKRTSFYKLVKKYEQK